MNSTIRCCSFALLCFMGACACADEGEAPRTVVTPGIEQTLLLSEPLAQFPGKRVTIFVGEFNPESATPFHKHPGTEFLYVLEGKGRMEFPDREAQDLSPGGIVLAEPHEHEEGFVHRAVNLSSEQGMKTLVIVIHDDGSPPAVPLD